MTKKKEHKCTRCKKKVPEDKDVCLRCYAKRFGVNEVCLRC